MQLLTWKPEYSVGVESVDHEHREMIAQINGVYTALNEGSGPDVVEHRLGEIHATIAAHFALEEQQMRRAKYPEYEAHKNDHEELLDQIRDLMDEFDSNPQAGSERLKETLANWFSKHFAGFDARLHKQLGI